MSGHTRLGGGAEFELIRSLVARFGDAADGIGDDAGVLPVPEGEGAFVSTDVAVENVHFRAGWLAPGEIGYRATMAALSDLAAMAATPRGLLVALTLPERWRASADHLADGIALAARDAACPIVGGDLSGGDALALAITVVGSTNRPLRRSGARPGDVVWVTGRLGGPGLALEAFLAGRTPDAAHARRFSAPHARIREAPWFAAHGATAAVDVSDGLAADLGHIAAASGVAITLDLDRLPLVAGASPEQAAASGEEYELAITAPATLDAGAFEREFGIPVTAVGAVHAAPPGGVGVTATRHGAPVAVPPGFDHLGE